AFRGARTEYRGGRAAGRLRSRPGRGRRCGWSCSRLEEASEFGGRNAHAHIERPEEGVDGADFIEAHFVDEALENGGVVGEKIDAPFPIVEADGSGNDLAHFAGVSAADGAVLLHHALAVGEGFLVPVLGLAAAAVHGVEADVAGGGNFRPEARGHGLAVAVEGGLDLLFPLVGVGLDALFDEGAVDLGGGFVDAELDDGEVGGGGLEEIADSEARQIALRLVELLEAAAEVDEQDVALVPEEGKQGGLAAVGGVLEGREGGGCLKQYLVAGDSGESAPFGSAEAHHLVQHAGAFDAQRNGWHGDSG